MEVPIVDQVLDLVTLDGGMEGIMCDFLGLFWSFVKFLPCLCKIYHKSCHKSSQIYTNPTKPAIAVMFSFFQIPYQGPQM